MTEPLKAPGLVYLAQVRHLTERVSVEGWSNIGAAADLVADALAAGHTVHVFGSGHSHMLSEAICSTARAASVRVSPILFEALMLYTSAPLSTSLERLPGLADTVLLDHPMDPEDVLIVASNSGSNAVTSELVRRMGRASHRRDQRAARDLVGGQVHRTPTPARARLCGNRRGFDTKVASTSTVVGAATLNAVVAEVVQRLVDRGIDPEVYTSSNAEGGDVANSRLLHKALAR